MVAFGEMERAGMLSVVAHCRNPGAADSLFETPWDQGWRTLGRRGLDSLWLEREEDPAEQAVLAPLDFDGLDDVVG